MTPRRLFLLLLAYVAFDLADPVLPGAFSFEVDDSEVEEAVHVRRRALARRTEATRPSPERERLARAGDPRPAVPRAPAAPAPVDASHRFEAPRSALLVSAPARSTEDH